MYEKIRILLCSARFNFNISPMANEVYLTCHMKYIFPGETYTPLSFPEFTKHFF